MILKLERHESGDGRSIRWELYGILDEDEQARERMKTGAVMVSTEIELAVGYTAAYEATSAGLRACFRSLLEYDFQGYGP